MLRRLGTLSVVLLAAVLCAWTQAPQEKTVTVTAYFGGQEKPTYERKVAFVTGGSVMDATRRAARVETNPEGTFLNSIEGVGNSKEHKEYWLYFMNGEPAHVSAADTKVKPGDRILWFLRRESSTQHAPAK